MKFVINNRADAWNTDVKLLNCDFRATALAAQNLRSKPLPSRTKHAFTAVQEYIRLIFIGDKNSAHVLLVDPGERIFPWFLVA